MLSMLTPRSAAALFIGIAAANSAYAKHDTYSVVLPTLPEKTDPWRNQVNVNNYINMHLYYPFLERAMDGRLQSEFLDLERTRALSADFRRYELCLRQGVKFSDGTLIRKTDLEAALKSAHQTEELLQGNATIRPGEGDCVTVELPKGDASYLDRLKSLAATVLKTESITSNSPIGLGPYRIVEQSRQMLRLELRNELHKPDRFRYLVFKGHDGKSGADASMIDWNHLYHAPVPQEAKDNAQVISRRTMKVYTLFVSWPDESARKAFATCVDRDEFAALTGLKLGKQSGFLPDGITGHDVAFDTIRSEKKAVKCDFPSRKPRLTLYNYNPAITDRLKAFFTRNTRQLPIAIDVQEIAPAKMERIVFSRKPYAAIIAFDSSSSLAGSNDEASTYFESFFREERLIRDPLRAVEKNVKAAIAARQRTEKTRYYRLAHEEVLRSGYIIPIGRLMTDQYYPKWISNITWDDELAGFPRVDKMRIVQ